MDIRECDDNMLLEELANRGIDARTIREFSMTEINNEITRRRMEAERAEVAQAEAEAQKELNRQTDRAEAELQAEARQAEYEAEMAQR